MDDHLRETQKDRASTRTFGAALAIMLLGTVTIGGVAGLWLVPPALGVIADSLLAPALARRIRATREGRVGVGLAADLLDPAREAFTSGLNLVAGLSAATVVIFAGLAMVLLRHVHPQRRGRDSRDVRR